MTHVYAVFFHEWDSCSCIGVFSTLDKANEALEGETRGRCDRGWYIEHIKIDEVGDYL